MASIYLRTFDEGEWICINDEETYEPGSLLKLPVLITYMKISESKPEILNKEIAYNKPGKVDLNTVYNSKKIELGHTYSIKQLLKYMIAYSDNKATELLMDNIDDRQFVKTFTDLGLQAPQKGQSIPVTAREYSIFLIALYNAAYLTIQDSEYATSLLGECDFKAGIVSGLPENIKVAHKFGESGDNNIHQLHETAIVYNNKSPYLLTIMTKGRDLKNLSSFLHDVSKLIYENVSVNNYAERN